MPRILSDFHLLEMEFRNASNFVRKIGNSFCYEVEIPIAKGNRCYSVNCFSLHANTAINTHPRDRLYKLNEYVARGPLSNKRLKTPSNGDVKLNLKTPWVNDTTHLVVTPPGLIEKLMLETLWFSFQAAALPGRSMSPRMIVSNDTIIRLGSLILWSSGKGRLGR